MKNLLLVYPTIGPSFRERSVRNILTNKKSYELFDILLLTDYKDDPIYDVLTEYSNVTIKEFDELRKNYEWSIEYEKLPIRTLDDEEYALDISNNSIYIPFSIYRFAFLYNNIEKYDGILFCNCDVVFTGDESTFTELSDLITSFEENVVFGHGAYDYTELLNSTADWIFSHSNFERVKESLDVNDGNFFCYCFKNKNDIKKYFDIMNEIIYKVLVDKIPELHILDKHGIWLVNNEPIQAIAHSAIDIKFKGQIHPPGMSLRIFPEDRYWSWGSSTDLNCTLKGKKHFVDINYDALKKHYERCNQVWEY